MTPSSLNLQLALISSDRRTIDGLKRYFERLGARLSSTSNLEEAPSSANGADAVSSSRTTTQGKIPGTPCSGSR